MAVPSDASAVAKYHALGFAALDEPSILGYYALAAAYVQATDLAPVLAKRYPRQIPVTRLGRLAVRTEFQGQGLGRLLLADAIARARHAALSVGSAGIFVDAKDERAARFYHQYGFTACADNPLKLFIPMAFPG